MQIDPEAALVKKRAVCVANTDNAWVDGECANKGQAISACASRDDGDGVKYMMVQSKINGDWSCVRPSGYPSLVAELAAKQGLSVDAYLCREKGMGWAMTAEGCVYAEPYLPGPTTDPNEGQQKCEYDGGVWDSTTQSCTKPTNPVDVVVPCGANEFYNQASKACEPYTTAASDAEKTCAEKKGVWNPTTGQCTLPVVDPIDPTDPAKGGSGTTTPTDKPEEKSYGGLVAALVLLTGVVVGVGVWYNKTGPKEQPRARTA